MIKDVRTLTMEQFLGKIFPHIMYDRDKLLYDFRDAVKLDRDFVMIFRDYEVRVPQEEVKKYLDEHGIGAGEELPDPIQSLLGEPEAAPAAPETPDEVEARKIAAKHPKPETARGEFPKFKPVKRAPVAPDEEVDV